MANRKFNQFVLTPESRQVMLAGKIRLNSSAAVLSHDLPFVASVVKTGTGAYTVTLQDKYVSLASAQLTYQGAEADVDAKLTSHDVSSAKTLVLRTETAGVAANVTAAAELHLLLILRDSSVPVK